MKKPPRTRPEVEPLERLQLLATFSPLAAIAPPPSTATVAKPAIAYAAAVATPVATPTAARPTISFGALNHAAATTPTPARTQVVGLPGVAGAYRAGQPPVFGSTNRPVVIATAGRAGLPTPTQASRRLVVLGSGSTPTNGRTNSLHAMIVAAESKPVVIGNAPHASPAPAAAPQAARLAVLGHGSAGVKAG